MNQQTFFKKENIFCARNILFNRHNLFLEQPLLTVKQYDTFLVFLFFSEQFFYTKTCFKNIYHPKQQRKNFFSRLYRIKIQAKKKPPIGGFFYLVFCNYLAAMYIVTSKPKRKSVATGLVHIVFLLKYKFVLKLGQQNPKLLLSGKL